MILLPGTVSFRIWRCEVPCPILGLVSLRRASGNEDRRCWVAVMEAHHSQKCFRPLGVQVRHWIESSGHGVLGKPTSPLGCRMCGHRAYSGQSSGWSCASTMPSFSAITLFEWPSFALRTMRGPKGQALGCRVDFIETTGNDNLRVLVGSGTNARKSQRCLGVCRNPASDLRPVREACAGARSINLWSGVPG